MQKKFPPRRSPLARAVTSLGLALTIHSALAQNLRFEIPAQPLPAALSAFARQTGLQLAFPPELVQVESGRVRVDAGGQTDELTAGQSLRAFEGRLRRDAIERPAPWRHGELQFHDMPLADALARVQRYSATRLSATPAAARLRISGELRVADAGDWLASLPRVLPVRLKALADGSVEVAAR